MAQKRKNIDIPLIHFKYWLHLILKILRYGELNVLFKLTLPIPIYFCMTRCIYDTAVI